jgi:hypothetical protein
MATGKVKESRDRERILRMGYYSFSFRFGILINGPELTIKLLPLDKEIPPEFVGPPETCAIYELSVIKEQETVPGKDV